MHIERRTLALGMAMFHSWQWPTISNDFHLSARFLFDFTFRTPFTSITFRILFVSLSLRFYAVSPWSCTHFRLHCYLFPALDSVFIFISSPLHFYSCGCVLQLSCSLLHVHYCMFDTFLIVIVTALSFLLFFVVPAMRLRFLFRSTAVSFHFSIVLSTADVLKLLVFIVIVCFIHHCLKWDTSTQQRTTSSGPVTTVMAGNRTKREKQNERNKNGFLHQMPNRIRQPSAILFIVWSVYYFGLQSWVHMMWL